jgi:hypothetical protein
MAVRFTSCILTIPLLLHVGITQQWLFLWLHSSCFQQIRHNNNNNVGFEVLTPVVMKNSIFWNITSRSPLRVNWYFGGTYRLHLQGWKGSQAKNKHEASNKLHLLLTSCYFLAWRTFCPRRWRWHVPPKYHLTYSGLHSIISQKVKLLNDKNDLQSNYNHKESEMEYDLLQHCKNWKMSCMWPKIDFISSSNNCNWLMR